MNYGNRQHHLVFLALQFNIPKRNIEGLYFPPTWIRQQNYLASRGKVIKFTISAEHFRKSVLYGSEDKKLNHAKGVESHY